MLGELTSAAQDNPYEYITRVLEANRVPMFEIITQYRAIFVDADDDESASDLLASSVTVVEHGKSTVKDDAAASSASPASVQGFLHFWVHKRVRALLQAIEEVLPRLKEGHVLATVLEQCMYCGFSLARVGVDFRGMLVPLFEKRVVDLFTKQIARGAEEFADSLTRYQWHLAPVRQVCWLLLLCFNSIAIIDASYSHL